MEKTPVVSRYWFGKDGILTIDTDYQNQGQERYRAEKDPARGMLTRFYGAEWTEEYIDGFLFDLERLLAGTTVP